MLDYAVKTMCFDAACTKQLFSGHYYSIVLVTRGTARFHWEAERWICSTEDLFLFKPGEGTVMVFPEASTGNAVGTTFPRGPGCAL